MMAASTSSTDLEYLQWVQIDSSPSFNTASTDAERSTLLTATASDTIEWYEGIAANRGDYMRSRGISTSGPEEYEYEEALQFTSTEVLTHFVGNGLAVNESDLAPMMPGYGRFFMTPVAEKWREQVRQGLLRPARFGDTVSQDNVGAPLDNGCGCGFDSRTNALFLATTAAQGLELPANFSAASHVRALRASGLAGDALVQERVVREIVRFHYKANLAAWKDIRDSVKTAAKDAGRAAIAVYGNVHIIEMVMAVLTAQYMDVVWTETPAYLPHVGSPSWGSPNSGWSALQHKLARAAGNFSKPHWGIVTLTGCGLAPRGVAPQSMTALVASAEAGAGGASAAAAMLYGDAVSNASSSGFGACFNAAQHWGSFVDHNRALLGADRRSVADVALLYSVPTMMWREDSSLSNTFDYHGLTRGEVFAAVGRVLQDAHILYDVLIVDHPDVSAFKHLEAYLSGFAVAVLPVVDAMSTNDAMLLAKWVRAGNTLVRIDPTATAMYDQDLSSWPINASHSARAIIVGLAAQPGKGSVRDVNGSDVQSFFRTNDLGAKARLSAACAPSSPVLSVSGLPETVWVNAWRHGSGPMHSLALTNYNGNASLNTLKSCCDHPVTLQLRCHQQAECATLDSALLVVLPANVTQQTPAPIPLALIHGPGQAVSVNLPAHALRGPLVMVVLSSAKGAEFTARVAAADARKWAEHLRVAGRMEFISEHSRTALLGSVEATSSALNVLQAVNNTHRNSSGLDYSRLTSRFETLGSAAREQLNNLTAASTAMRRADREATLNTSVNTFRISAGPTGASTAGWELLSPSLVFDPNLGFGWNDTTSTVTAVSSVDVKDAINDDLVHGTHLTARQEATLMLALPLEHGPCTIEVVTGALDASRLVATTAIRVVSNNNISTAVTIAGDLVRSGIFQHRVIVVAADTVNVSLTFGPEDVAVSGSFYGDGYGQGLFAGTVSRSAAVCIAYGMQVHQLTFEHAYSSLFAGTWTLNALLVNCQAGAPLGALTPQAAANLARSAALARGQLIVWATVGPFLDPHFTVRERIIGPQDSLPNPAAYNQTYNDGAAHTLSWQRLEVPVSAFRPIPVRLKAEPDRKGSVSFASTYVYVSGTPGLLVNATVVGSMSSSGTVWLNGLEVWTDRVVSGQHLEELSRDVSLLPETWNHILVRTSRLSWVLDWSFALSLLPRDGQRALPGMKVAVCSALHDDASVCHQGTL